MPSYSFTYLFSSSLGVVDPSTDGSVFDVDMSRYPLTMPQNTKCVTLSVPSASVSYVTPNILLDVNDMFYFNYLGVNYTLKIPQGLYSLNSLQSQINIGLSGLALPANIFYFIGNSSTQKCSIQFQYANCFIDFTQNKNFGILMGYNNVITPPAPSILGEITTAPDIAEFDSLKGYLISTNLVSSGLPLGGSLGRGIIAAIPINGQPGSRLVYSPSLPILINGNELINQKRTSARFQILDQNAQQIKMLNQEWSFILQFTYDL